MIQTVYLLIVNYQFQGEAGVAATNVSYLEQEHLDLGLFQLGSKKVKRSQNCWLEEEL